jgi:hypothetical protein
VAVKGLKELEVAFNRKLREIEGATAEAFTDVILDLTRRSVELAPVLTGDLRGTGRGEINGLEVAKGSKDGSIQVTGSAPKTASELSGSVSFGTPYARYQHEGLDFKHPQGGQAKYLEQPFLENQEKYLQHLRNSVQKEVK